MARKHSNTQPAQAGAQPTTPVQAAPATQAPPVSLALANQVLAHVASTVQAAPTVPTPASVRAAALAALAASATPPAWLNTAIVGTLPPSLIAKGAGLLAAPKGIPAKLAGGHYVTNGLLYQRARQHNLAWATTCASLCSAPGGATVAQMVAAGVGLHSVQAYLKRGWFVPATQA